MWQKVKPRSRAEPKHGHVQDRNTVTCWTETRSHVGTKTVMCRTETSQVQDQNTVTCWTEARSRAGPKHGHVQDRNTVTCRTGTRSRAGPEHGHVQDRNTVTCRTGTRSRAGPKHGHVHDRYNGSLSPSPLLLTFFVGFPGLLDRFLKGQNFLP